MRGDLYRKQLVTKLEEKRARRAPSHTGTKQRKGRYKEVTCTESLRRRDKQHTNMYILRTALHPIAVSPKPCFLAEISSAFKVLAFAFPELLSGADQKSRLECRCCISKGGPTQDQNTCK